MVTKLRTDEIGKDVGEEVAVDEERDLSYCRWLCFRQLSLYDGYRNGAPTSDAVRFATGRIAYEDELILCKVTWLIPW